MYKVVVAVLAVAAVAERSDLGKAIAAKVAISCTWSAGRLHREVVERLSGFMGLVFI